MTGWWLLGERSVWPVAVVVGGVLGQDVRQVPFADDEHAVGAFAAYRATRRSANAFARGACGGVLSTSIPAAVKTMSKAAVKLRIPVTHQEPEPDVDLPGGQFDEEQHVDPFEAASGIVGGWGRTVRGCGCRRPRGRRHEPHSICLACP